MQVFINTHKHKWIKNQRRSYGLARGARLFTQKLCKHLELKEKIQWSCLIKIVVYFF